MKMGFRPGLGLALACLLLAACATPYQKNSVLNLAGGGFGEKRISDSEYWVYFNGNGIASKDHVISLWIYRCAELTVEKGYEYLMIKPGTPDPGVGALGWPGTGTQLARLMSPPSSPRLTPAVYRPGTGGGLQRVGYYYVPGATYTTWNSKGTVTMYHKPFPDDLVWVMDARKLMQQLAPYKDANGGQAPSVQSLIDGSMVTHEQVTFPAAGHFPVIKVPDPAAVAGNTPPARSDRDVLAAMNKSMMAFHSMFHARKKIENLSNPGSIVLSFTVSPAGAVTDCHLVSTTFTDLDFVNAVQSVVRRMSFPYAEASVTTVPAFKIAFAPNNS